MPIKRPHATSNKLAIAMFVRSVIVCEIFIDETFMTLTLTVRMFQGQMQIYQFEKPTDDFLS